MPSSAADSSTVPAPRLERLTPVLIVDEVAPCVAFWTNRFGFQLTTEVPGADGAAVFAIVERGGIEIMYQSRASVMEDGTYTAEELRGHSIALFITVTSLDDAERALEGAPVVKPRHDTFYGSTEIYVKEPGGNTVGFAQMR